MFICTIEIEGQEKGFKFPEKVNEISLWQYCQYESKYNSMSDEFKNLDIETLDGFQTARYIHNMVELLSCFTDCDLNELMSIPLNTKFKGTKQVINELQTLFFYITKMIAEYQPQKRTYFKYKGQKFIFPHQTISKLTKQPQNPKLTAGEAILMFQYNHIFQKAKDAQGTFYKLLGMIAVLCRKDKEKLPISEFELDKFQENRIQFFKGIGMDIGLDIYSFFLNIPNLCARIGLYNTHLSQLESQLDQIQSSILN